MAEISSLLGLITDDQTRQALIAQMENMFDNAPDEERLIQEIGNPTKVAVALIRYADSGKITPAAAPVVAPAQAQPRRTPQPRPRAEQYRPMTAAAAQRPAPSFTFPDLPEEPDEPETDEAPVLDGQLSFDEQPADDDGYYDEQPADDDGYYDEQPADDDGYYDEQPADDDGYYDEQPAEEYGEEYDEEYYDDYEPEYKTNVFLAILYTLGAIIVGVPVLAVLLVLARCLPQLFAAKPVQALLCLAAPLVAAFTWALSLVYDKDNKLMAAIDFVLSRRISLAYNTFGMEKLYGNQHFFFGQAFISDGFYRVDNSYIYYYYLCGPIMVALICLGFVLLTYRLLKQGDLPLALAVAMFTVYAVMEHCLSPGLNMTLYLMPIALYPNAEFVLTLQHKGPPKEERSLS